MVVSIDDVDDGGSGWWQWKIHFHRPFFLASYTEWRCWWLCSHWMVMLVMVFVSDSDDNSFAKGPKRLKIEKLQVQRRLEARKKNSILGRKKKLKWIILRGNCDFSFYFFNLTHIVYVDCQKTPYRRTNEFNRAKYEDE